MRNVISYAVVAALTALPVMAEAKGKGDKNSKSEATYEKKDKGKKNDKKAEKKREKNNDKKEKNDKKGKKNERKSAGNGNIDKDLARLATGIAAASGLIYLAPDVSFASISAEELQNIANCPPGLAKKDPPCVPPGLAQKGVTYSDWTGYSEGDLRNLLDKRWESYAPVPTEAAPSPSRSTDTGDTATSPQSADIDNAVPSTAPPVVMAPGTLPPQEVDDLTETPAGSDLTSDRITEIFDLPEAPADKQYAVIDGRPVLLSAQDYARLLTLNDLAERPTLADGVTIVPDAALDQDQLISTYGLPALAAGKNYAVLDNQIIALPDQSYDMLQLIRILGAV